MRDWRKFWLVGLMVGLMIVSGCGVKKVDEEKMENGEMNSMSEDNNAALFDKDFSGDVVFEDVSNGNLMGFVAKPKVKGDYPGVVMIHEWWGLNDNVKYMAKLLASEGYNVFAVDLYDGKVANSSEQARELAGAVRDDVDGAVAKMKAAADYLEKDLGSKKLASLGWCFGGGESLNLALNDKLDATVIYYGNLVDDKEQLKNIDWPVLGIFGSEDQNVSVDSVKKFQAALDELGVKNDINIYEGVGHAFANPSGANYAADETVDAWNKTVKFLGESLKGEGDVMAMDGGAAMESGAMDSGEGAAMDEVTKEVVFDLAGENFAFKLNGAEAQVLKVKKGQKVKINFTSADGFHDWVVDEFDASTRRVNTGQSTSVEFVADKTGEFEYYCSVGSHRARGMKGKLVVE